MTRVTCPICGDSGTPRYRPFCSRKCADVDLGRWMNGRYRVPASSPGSVDYDEAANADWGDGAPARRDRDIDPLAAGRRPTGRPH